MTQAELDRRKVDPVLDKAIPDMLQLKAIRVIPRDTRVIPGAQGVSEQCLHGTQAGAGQRVQEEIHPQPKGECLDCYSRSQEDRSISNPM